jgi:outer membrane immunogenic protein
MKLTIAVAAVAALLGTSAFAADPAPAPSWTGWYGGIEFGGGWGDEPVNYSPNDPNTATLFNGGFGGFGEQPVANGYRVSQSGAVGGLEAGYNWQRSSWLLGVEADFSGAGMSGRASGTSFLANIPGVGTSPQTITGQQSTDWYGTVRGRAGWLATPNLLLFGTGGFAYGRVAGSAQYVFTGTIVTSVGNCSVNVTCFAGSSSTTRTGWTAGGGVEYLLDQHWTAKVEYQFVDLGDQTVLVPSIGTAPFGPPFGSFNAVFHNRFNVVRLGLNYQFH